MTVAGRHERGPIRHDAVEQVAGRQPAGKHTVVPAVAEHPGPIGVCAGEGGDRRLDGRQGGRPEQVGAIHREAGAQQVQVRVVEAGQQRAAPGVDLDGLRPPQAAHLARAPDAQDLVAANRHRAFEGRRPVGREHLRVEDDQIDRPAVVVPLGADNEAGDHRDGHDRDDDERGETRGHGLLRDPVTASVAQRAAPRAPLHLDRLVVGGHLHRPAELRLDA